MAKRCLESDDSNTVFIDTNLDTHLAMIVSDSDTVSDLKKKIMLEHPLCFPKTGEIKISALKVKRKGYFYHLSDSMLVKSAFEGVKKNWFLSADASSMKQESEKHHSSKLDSSKQLALVCLKNNASGRNILPDDPSTSAIHEVSLRQPANETQCTEHKVPITDTSSPRDSCRENSKDVEIEDKDITNDHSKNVPSDVKIQKNDDISEGTKLVSEKNDDKSKNVISGVQFNNPVEQSLQTKPPAKKKRKIKKNNEHIVQPEALPEPSGFSLKEKHSNIAQEVVERTKVSSSSLGQPKADNVKGESNDPELAAKGIKSSKKHRSTFTAPLVIKETDNLHSNVGHSVRKNTVGDDHKSAKIVECQGAKEATEKIDKMEEEPVLSVHLTIAKEDMESGKSSGSKRKKRRAIKSSSRNQDESEDDTTTLSHAGKEEVPKEMPMNVSSAGADKEGKTVNGNEAELFTPTQMKRSEGNAENVDEKSSKKKRRKSQISTAKSLAHNPIKEQVVEVESLQVNQVEETQDAEKTDNGLKPVGFSSTVADRVGDNMNGNEAEPFSLTRTKRSEGNAENVNEKSSKKGRKSLISTAKSVIDNPIKEQGVEVETLQVNQVEVKQDAEKTSNKLKKKTKNAKSKAKSHPDLSIKEQKVGVEELTASNGKLSDVDPPSKPTNKRNSVKAKAVNQRNGSGLEPEHISTNVDSSRVLFPDVLEDISKGRPENKIDADKHVEISKCESDNINFKNYFMPGQVQNGSASADKMKEAAISDMVINTKKNMKSTKKSHVKSSSNTQPQGSLLKDENNEVMLPPKNKSSEVSKNGVKAPSIQDIDQFKAPQEVRRADFVSISGKENHEPVSASSSSSESSDGSLQNRGDNKHQPSLDPYLVAVTKSSAKNIGEGVAVKKASAKNAGEVVNSSQQPKSLFIKPDAIFTDDSSGSSADGNGSMNSNASTCTPSCNSSSSGLGGESDSTLDSPKTATGLYGTERKEGGTNAMKLQTSLGPKNITMDMIFRSSSRYKAAKLTASQLQLGDSESQPVEFVPDSQGNP